MTITDERIDQLFSRQQRMFTTTTMPRITCRACEQPRQAVALGVLLCVECASDIDALREHVRTTLASYHARIGETWGALEQQIPESPYQMPDGRYVSELGEGESLAGAVATDPLRRRWDSYQEAIGTAAARQAEDKARAGMPGPLADLIRLWLAYQDAIGIYTERRAWADKVETQIAFYTDEVL